MPPLKKDSRLAYTTIFSEEFGRQMRFISGPRQCGKTTLAQVKLRAEKCMPLYFNWDVPSVRAEYRASPDFLETYLLETTVRSPWTCMDEIHKLSKWKNVLKGLFDTYSPRVRFIVTGSAKLDMFRRAGDSLAGRYFPFKLHPFILAEVLGKSAAHLKISADPLEAVRALIGRTKSAHAEFEQLLKFSGFPEPLFNGRDLFAKKWHANYFERLVYEDIRSISQIGFLDKVMDLVAMLPARVGAPLSINALSRDLELNFQTIKTYLKYLNQSYISFQLPPYSPSDKFVKKETKLYFYDWAWIQDPAACFENYVAMELLVRTDLWSEWSTDTYALHFVRSRDGSETDFLITKNKNPFWLIEAKVSDLSIAKHHYEHQAKLGGIPLIQVVQTPNVLKGVQPTAMVVSASRFFA